MDWGGAALACSYSTSVICREGRAGIPHEGPRQQDTRRQALETASATHQQVDNAGIQINQRCPALFTNRATCFMPLGRCPEGEKHQHL